MTDLHGLDLAMLAVIALSVLIGLWRGLVFELMSLAGWAVAYVGALVWSGVVGRYIPIGEPGSALNHAAAVLATFLAILVAWTLLARLLRALVSATPLTVPDRLLGAAFGALRGLLLLVLLATATSLTPAAQSEWWRQSRGVQWLDVVIAGLRPWLPQDLARWLPAARPGAR